MARAEFIAGSDDRYEPAEQSIRPAREAALVTGAGNGIGRAIAQALVGEGVRTVFADVNRIRSMRRSRPRRAELATAWVGDLAQRAAAMRCWPMRK